MRILVDAQISPRTAEWIAKRFKAEAIHVSDMGLLIATDSVIFESARQRQFDIVLSKDEDFQAIVRQTGGPPSVIWLTCGNCSNEQLHQILDRALPGAFALCEQGDAVIEISDVGIRR